MPAPTAVQLTERVVEHAGGAERWEALEELRLRVRCSGLAFRLMGKVKEVAEMEQAVRVHDPRVELTSVSAPEWRGRLEGDTASMLGRAGSGTAMREHAVRPRRLPWPASPWDDIAALAFCAYASWNYVTFPVLLRRPDLRVDAIGRRSIGGERLHGLRLSFPASVPTHSPRQTFWVDDEGALRRHDYTARMVGPVAKAANRCVHETSSFGITLPDRRIVTPALPLRRAAPRPVLVDVTIDVLGVTER